MFVALSAASESVNPAVINTVSAALTLAFLALTAGWLVYLFRD
jgi:hypothetical protein